MSNTNRQRGDYLERCTKRALETEGWFVIRAAGSHGIADLVALERRHTPLLISCKTTGTIGPAERRELMATAERAGASPLLATRVRRGWVSLYRVHSEAIGLLVRELTDARATDRPVRLLDEFCAEGGASVGYSRAGFDVYGIDTFDRHTQARYPFPSHKGDAILATVRLLAGETIRFGDEDLGLADFSAVAASPPCQTYSITRHTHSVDHPDLLGPTRYLLRATGLLYVIENVPGAPLETPMTLCGTEFDLTATDGDGQPLYLKRHRLFESNLFLIGNGGCRCREYKRRGYAVGGAYGGGSRDRTYAREVRHGGYTPSKDVRQELLGVEWMTLDGMSQCVPPAYAEHIGRQLVEALS